VRLALVSRASSVPSASLVAAITTTTSSSSSITTTGAMIQPGQFVAAYVPYTKRTKSWIMATIVRWLDDQQMYVHSAPPPPLVRAVPSRSLTRALALFLVLAHRYIVEDCYPDKKKKVYQWPVPADKAISFPSPMDEVYEIGDKVLSLWLEDNQWSSMFYDACVVEPAGPVCTLTSHIRTSGSFSYSFSYSFSCARSPRLSPPQHDTHLRIQYSGSSKDVFTVCKDRLVKRLPSKGGSRGKSTCLRCRARKRAPRPSHSPSLPHRGAEEKRKREDGADDGPSSKRPKSSDNSSDSDDSADERKPGPKLMELSPHLNGSGGAGGARRAASPRNGALANGNSYAAAGAAGRRRTSNAALEDAVAHFSEEAAMNPNECCLLRHASGGPIAKKMMKLIALYAERDRSTTSSTSASQMAT